MLSTSLTIFLMVQILLCSHTEIWRTYTETITGNSILIKEPVIVRILCDTEICYKIKFEYQFSASRMWGPRSNRHVLPCYWVLKLWYHKHGKNTSTDYERICRDSEQFEVNERGLMFLTAKSYPNAAEWYTNWYIQIWFKIFQDFVN